MLTLWKFCLDQANSHLTCFCGLWCTTKYTPLIGSTTDCHRWVGSQSNLAPSWIQQLLLFLEYFRHSPLVNIQAYISSHNWSLLSLLSPWRNWNWRALGFLSDLYCKHLHLSYVSTAYMCEWARVSESDLNFLKILSHPSVSVFNVTFV